MNLMMSSIMPITVKEITVEIQISITISKCPKCNCISISVVDPGFQPIRDFEPMLVHLQTFKNLVRNPGMLS